MFLNDFGEGLNNIHFARDQLTMLSWMCYTLWRKQLKGSFYASIGSKGMDRTTTSGNLSGHRLMVCKRNRQSFEPHLKFGSKRRELGQFTPVRGQRVLFSYPFTSDSILREISRVVDLRGSFDEYDLATFEDIRSRWSSRQFGRQTGVEEIRECWGAVGRHLRGAIGAYRMIEGLEEVISAGDDLERTE